MILSRIILFVIYVALVAAGTMWRFADAWGSLPFGSRVFLALGKSWKWWLLFSVALLCRDAFRYSHRGVSGDIVVIAIAIVMTMAFAILRPVTSRASAPHQKK